MSKEASDSHQLPAGTLLNNKYEIVDLLGEGGFGITYLGRDTVLDINVAIKEFYPKGYASRDVLKNLSVTIIDKSKDDYFSKWRNKFLTEARMLAKFSTFPGIVNVRDYFEQNDTAYIIMEYLDGITIKNYVEKNGPITDTNDFFVHLIQVLKSLDKIHKQGLIHRDISPDNLMLMPDGFLKLYDFGAAKEYSDLTQSNFTVIIKPCFAPVEQYSKKGNQGPWTDVYSICATIYYSITGEIPDDALQRIEKDELKKPSALGAKISSKIEAAILKGMSLRREDRYDSIEPLIAVLEDAAKKVGNFKKGKKEQNIKKPPNSKKDTISKLFGKIYTTSAHSIASSTEQSQNIEATEIILTEYHPSEEHSGDYAVDNEVKRRPRNIQEDSRQVKSQNNDNVAGQTSKQVSANSVVSKSSDKSVTTTSSHSNATANKGESTKAGRQSSGQMKMQNNNNRAGQTAKQVSVNSIVPKSSDKSVATTSSHSNVTANKGKNTQSDSQSNVGNKSVIACPKCKTFLPKDAKFCGICGTLLVHKLSGNSDVNKNTKISSRNTTPVSTREKTQSEQKGENCKTDIVCPKCTTLLPKGAKFCGICGASLSDILP